MQSWRLHIFLHAILRTYKVCLLKSTYSVLGDLVSSMSKLGMRSTWYNSHRQKRFSVSGGYIINCNVSSANRRAFWETPVGVSLVNMIMLLSGMCPPQMEVHFEKLMWVFHFSKCFASFFNLVLSCNTWQVSTDKIKKKLLVFYTSTNWGVRHLQNKHPSTLGPSALGRCLFWECSTRHILPYT